MQFLCRIIAGSIAPEMWRSSGKRDAFAVNAVFHATVVHDEHDELSRIFVSDTKYWQHYTLVYGPNGSGKTRTLFSAIAHATHTHPERKILHVNAADGATCR